MSKMFFIRKIDELGRVVIPMEIRKILDIEEKDSLSISLENNYICIRKDSPYCVFCNSSIELISFYDKHICKKCLKILK